MEKLKTARGNRTQREEKEKPGIWSRTQRRQKKI